MSGYVAGPSAASSQAMTGTGGMIAGGGVYGPGYLAQGGGGMGSYGGYGTGGNPGMDAQSRDFAMDMMPPTKDLRRAAHGVAFRTDLSKMGGSAAGGQSIFGRQGPTDQVAEERRLIDKVFSICDKDNSGTIDVKELKELLSLCNVDSTFIDSSIDRMMANSDQDKDNMISPEEFHAILSQKFGPKDSREDIIKVFGKIDENKDKFLDPDEIMKVAAYMGETISREEVVDMIEVFSLDYQRKVREFKSRPRDAPKMERPQPPSKMTEEDFVAVMHRPLGGEKSTEAEEGNASGQTGGAPRSANEMMFYQKSIF